VSWHLESSRYSRYLESFGPSPIPVPPSSAPSPLLHLQHHLVATLSNMPEDQPLSKDGRLSSLEQAIDDLRSQSNTTGSLLQTMQSKLGASNQIPPSPHHCICTSSLPAGQKGFSLKPSPPLAFNGDRSMGKAFLTSCRIFIRLCPGGFKDEVTKMIWAMSYMNTGWPAKWAFRELEREALSGRF